MQRTLYTPEFVGGGPTQLAIGLKGTNTVFVTNNDTNNDVFLGHSRDTLMIRNPVTGGIQGYKIAKATSQQIPDWVGDMWGVASADGTNCDIEVTQL